MLVRNADSQAPAQAPESAATFTKLHGQLACTLKSEKLHYIVTALTAPIPASTPDSRPLLGVELKMQSERVASPPMSCGSW